MGFDTKLLNDVHELIDFCSFDSWTLRPLDSWSFDFVFVFFPER